MKSIASTLNLLPIFCGNVHLQEMYGLYAEAKYRNSQMLLKSFSSYSATYWTSSHARNLNNGLWSVGQYGMLKTDFSLKSFKIILNLFWLGCWLPGGISEACSCSNKPVTQIKPSCSLFQFKLESGCFSFYLCCVCRGFSSFATNTTVLPLLCWLGVCLLFVRILHTSINFLSFIF